MRKCPRCRTMQRSELTQCAGCKLNFNDDDQATKDGTANGVVMANAQSNVAKAVEPSLTLPSEPSLFAWRTWSWRVWVLLIFMIWAGVAGVLIEYSGIPFLEEIGLYMFIPIMIYGAIGLAPTFFGILLMMLGGGSRGNNKFDPRRDGYDR